MGRMARVAEFRLRTLPLKNLSVCSGLGSEIVVKNRKGEGFCPINGGMCVVYTSQGAGEGPAISQRIKPPLTGMVVTTPPAPYRALRSS